MLWQDSESTSPPNRGGPDAEGNRPATPTQSANPGLLPAWPFHDVYKARLRQILALQSLHLDADT